MKSLIPRNCISNGNRSISSNFGAFCDGINWRFSPSAASAAWKEGNGGGNPAFKGLGWLLRLGGVLPTCWIRHEDLFSVVLSSWIKLGKDQTRERHKSICVVLAVTRETKSEGGLFYSAFHFSCVCAANWNPSPGLQLELFQTGAGGAKVMSARICKALTCLRQQMSPFRAHDPREHLQMNFHMLERSSSLVREPE